MSELQPLYQLDILGTGYEQATLNFPDDYEGKVVATLIRKKAAQPTKKAVLYRRRGRDQIEVTSAWGNRTSGIRTRVCVN